MISWLAVLPVPAGLHAQQSALSRFDQQQFIDDNGLPQNSIKAIAADKEGFIWLITEDGLVRYDGKGFITFKNPGIPVRSNRMVTFQPAPIDGKNSFYAINEYSEYLGIRNGTVVPDTSVHEQLLSGMPFSREHQEKQAFMSQSLPNAFVEAVKLDRGIIQDNRGGFFVCTPHGVTYYKGLQQQYEVKLELPGFHELFRLGNALYLVNNKGAVQKFEDGKAVAASLYGDILQHKDYRPGTRNFDIYWNNTSGQAFLYIGTSMYFVSKDASGNLGTRLVLTDFDCKKNNIIAAYFDEASLAVFLGSSSKGLFVFTPRQFHPLSIGGDDKDNIYYALWPFGNNRVLTTQGNVLGVNGTSELPLLKAESGIDRYSMLIDRNGYIWIKDGDFVKKFDRQGKKLLSKWNIESELTRLYEGLDGQIWIGSRNAGLYRIDPADPDAVPRLFLSGEPFTEISFILQEPADMLWIGTSHGLYRRHLRQGVTDTIKGLENLYIRSLYIPRSGEVWITTYGAGFFLYANNRLTHFPEDKAGYLATSHCLAEDNRGYCWITTNKGLFQFAKKDLLNYAAGKQQQVFYLYHARNEGFLTNEFNGGCQPCVAQLPNGQIAFPSLNGVVIFMPDSLRITLPDKKIFIDRIEVDQQSMPIRDSITISRKFRLLKLHCSTPYIGNEYNINLQYAWVRGNEKPVWLQLDNSRIISQSSLENGAHTLIIRKMNGFGNGNFTYRKLTVMVPPAFYETAWFYGAMTVLLIFLVWLYARLRVRYIRNRNRQLEQLVGERTEELQNALSALSVSEQNIRRQAHIREILFTAISHDIGSPLKYIAVLAEKLKEDIEAEKVPDNMKKHAGSIYQSGYYLYHLTRNLLQYLRVSRENTSLHYEQFNLHRLVEDKAIVFRAIARERSVAVINGVPEGYDLYYDPLLLEVIIHNLLDNAVKVTKNGIVRVYVNGTDEATHLVIEDSGPGMRKEIAGFYNKQHFTDAEQEKFFETHPGFGLNIVNELIRLTGITLRIETGAQGTSVHIIFENQ